jgi:hypothetical protein
MRSDLKVTFHSKLSGTCFQEEITRMCLEANPAQEGVLGKRSDMTIGFSGRFFQERQEDFWQKVKYMTLLIKVPRKILGTFFPIVAYSGRLQPQNLPDLKIFLGRFSPETTRGLALALALSTFLTLFYSWSHIPHKYSCCLGKNFPDSTHILRIWVCVS